MTLSANFIDLIDQQEALEAKRTKVLLQLEASNVSAEIRSYRRCCCCR